MKDIQNIFLAGSLLFIFSSIVYTFKYVGDERWFSRLALGLICLGFYAILKKMDNGKH